MERGITKVVEKDMLNLDIFTQKLMKEIVIMLFGETHYKKMISSNDE